MTGALFQAWYFADSSSASDDLVAQGSDGSARRARNAARSGTAGRSSFEIAQDIVERVRHRDVAAFDQLMRIAHEPLVRFAYSFVHTQDGAEDVVQDVLAHVWHLEQRWRPSGSAAAYLLAAVRNEALKLLRHRKVEARYETRVHDAWVPDQTAGRLLGPDELLVWQERMRAFEAILLSLTERQRTAFVLRYEQGLTVPAIAAVLGVSTKGAEKLVSRVTHLLRERLREIR